MAALTKSRERIPASFWPLLTPTLLGVGLAIYRLVVGLGPTTNLTDHYPWGLWITVDLFLIPFAGAAFTISIISYFLGRQDYHSVIRPAVLVGFIGYGVVGVLLFMDIGRWNHFYNIFVFPWLNLHSFLEEISLCVTLYTGILILEIAPVFLEKWGYKVPIRWIERGIFVIAGAGIVVRNSIILVDFIELRLSEGMPLDQAVIDAGAVRFRPMVLTAAAVVVGASVILFDPIFQGLAISLMAGEVASLLFSRMTVPILYFMEKRWKRGRVKEIV